MIVVEGMDNTGKTTLVEKLAEDFDLNIIPSHGFSLGIRNFAWQSIREDNHNDLYDRARFLSEAIYGPILRGRMQWSLEEWFRMMGEWLLKPQLVVYCLRPMREVEESFQKDQLRGVWDKRYVIAEAYESLMNFLDLLFRWGSQRQGIVFRYQFSQPNAYYNLRSTVTAYFTWRVAYERSRLSSH